MNSDDFAPLIQTNQFKNDLNDVIGLDKAKEDIKRYLTDFKESILVYGGPGFGKTFFLKAICHEFESKLSALFFNVANFTLSGRPLAEYLFKQACLKQPCILVLDDLETLFLNQKQFADVISTIATSFKKITDDSMKVVLVGITNRPWILTDEFRNMFKVGIEIGLPNSIERELLFKQAFGEQLKLDDVVNIKELAAKTDGYSGADLTSLARAICLVPCRKFMSSTHFREIQAHNEGGNVKYKCSTKDDPDAFEMNPLDIDLDMIMLDPINKNELNDILARHKATVRQDEIEKFTKFTMDYF